MEFGIVIGILIILAFILAIVEGISIKKVKEIAENKELNEISKTFPENIEIAKTILAKLGNTTVQIEEEKDTKTSLYLVMSNKIIIANIRRQFYKSTNHST